jgi:hypothetical protein
MGQLVGAVLRRDQLVVTENFIRDATGFVWNTIATSRCECSERASYGVSQGELTEQQTIGSDTVASGARGKGFAFG